MFRMSLAILLIAGVAATAQPLKPLPSNVVFREKKPRLKLLGPGLTPVVAVAVGQRGPIPLLFDTGCSGLIMFDRIVKPTGMKARKVEARVGTGGESAVTAKRAARIEKLYLLAGSTPQGYLTDVDALLFTEGPPVHGIMTHGVFGGRLFQPLLVTFNLKEKWLTLEVASLPEPDGKTVVSMRGGDLAIPGNVAGNAVHFTIDTGHNGGIIIPPKMAQKLKFKRKPVPIGSLDSAGGSSPTSVARLDGDIRLGQWILRDPIVNISGVTGSPNLGVEALRHWTLSLDQSHGRARLVREGDTVIHTLPYRRLAVSVETRDGACVVTHVDERAPAHKAGLRKGDVITWADGLPGPKFTDWHIAELQRDLRRRGVRLKIRRGDEAKQIDVPFGIIVP